MKIIGRVKEWLDNHKHRNELVDCIVFQTQTAGFRYWRETQRDNPAAKDVSNVELFEYYQAELTKKTPDLIRNLKASPTSDLESTLKFYLDGPTETFIEPYSQGRYKSFGEFREACQSLEPARELERGDKEMEL